MRLGRITRYALLLVPLVVVCMGRLHAQRGSPPASLLQEANRCLSLVRATSRRRQRNEREQRLEPVSGAVRTDAAAMTTDHHGDQTQQRRAS